MILISTHHGKLNLTDPLLWRGRGGFRLQIRQITLFETRKCLLVILLIPLNPLFFSIIILGKFIRHMKKPPVYLFTLLFTAIAAPAQVNLTSSNLPLVIITTPDGQSIVNEPKITAAMKIIHNGTGQRNTPGDPGNVYDGVVGIEIRGRHSSSLPQKPYGFETRDTYGENLNVALLGMPEENDWILTANYNDKTFLRNLLAFEIFRKMGHYAPGTRYCEVILNGSYDGIYLLCEKIKQDKNRVNIAKLNPDENSGDDLTGGYIFSTDYYTDSDSWLSDYSPVNKPGGRVHFVYCDPKPDELSEVQKAYLRDHVNSFESVLYSRNFADKRNGYHRYLDVNSFVDYFILGELTRNVDAYKKSRFFHKDKDSDGGLIHSGPPWDYDWAWKDITENCIHFNQTDGSGWAYRINECGAWPVPPSWEVRLMQDKDFSGRIYNRWFSLRKTILSEEYLHHVIDSVAVLLDEAQERHFTRWDILGLNVGTPEYGEQPDSYAGEIEKFKSWIARRLVWLDANMVGKPDPGNDLNTFYKVYPVPAGNQLQIESEKILISIEIYSVTGTRIRNITNSGSHQAAVDVSFLDPGLYILRMRFASGEVVSRKFVKQ